MKKILLLFFILINCVVTKAQVYLDNFESPNQIPLTIDTTSGNIWEIGKPNKIYFDSAYSVPNAIVTDTLNYYPPNNHSSFTITISSNTIFWQIHFMQFYFIHKYDTDSSSDGGFITESYDGGITWIDIFHDPMVAHTNGIYSQSDTIKGGIPAFSGHSNGWQSSEIDYSFCFATADSVMIRFNFKSDSINNNKEGWMIDNLRFTSQLCEGINEYNADHFTISPNPLTSSSLLQFDTQLTDAEVVIYDVVGKEMMRRNFSGDRMEIERGGLESGVYFVRVRDGERQWVEKMVVE